MAVCMNGVIFFSASATVAWVFSDSSFNLAAFFFSNSISSWRVNKSSSSSRNLAFLFSFSLIIASVAASSSGSTSYSSSSSSSSSSLAKDCAFMDALTFMDALPMDAFVMFVIFWTRCSIGLIILVIFV